VTAAAPSSFGGLSARHLPTPIAADQVQLVIWRNRAYSRAQATWSLWQNSGIFWKNMDLPCRFFFGRQCRIRLLPHARGAIMSYRRESALDLV
jgi:hypothetical protein